MPGVVDEMGLGFALLGAEGNVLAADARYAAMVGRSLEDVVGLTLESCTHPDDLSNNHWLLQKALTHGGVFDLRKRYLRPDDTALWVEQRVIALEGDPPRLILVTAHPIRTHDSSGAEHAFDSALAGYVADMGAQLSAMALRADMPLTAELLSAAARTAIREADQS